MKKSVSISRDNLVSLGTCIGKFTKTRKFRLHITSLDIIASYAKVCSRHVFWGVHIQFLFLSLLLYC